MAPIATYIACIAALFGISYYVYRRFNMGLARNSRGQQFRRYLIASIMAFLPAISAGLQPYAPPVAMAMAVSLLWIFTYNVLYDMTNRNSSPDYDNHMDIAFGIYLFGWLTGLYAVLSPLGHTAEWVLSTVETVLIIPPVIQIGYYLIYRTCIDATGMQVVQETNANEIIEFAKSFRPVKVVLTILAVIAAVSAIALCNTLPATKGQDMFYNNISPIRGTVLLIITAAITVFFTVYIWKRHHGLFMRTGIAMLYMDILDYRRGNSLYRLNMHKRLQELNVEQNGPKSSRPSTILMVIGESACRDYMSVFCPQNRETTPWQSKMKEDKRHFILFPNAYSCAMQTVPSLERGLTECNQYNGKDFLSSCSIVDIAHKAGYTVHWYSNQGHLGCADTPITLVAETSDTAKWTRQELNKIQYDKSLLEFLDEVDPEKNNFVVLHLKGSHFNYTNRYSSEYASENGLTEGNDVHNYKNSIHYTDSILHSFYEYATKRLNLQAMVYFSDHGAIPDMRRSPRFLGFGMVRIPLWVYLSEEYIANHPHVAEALSENREKYFTNDLAYELICGLLDIQSNHYDETGSVASPKYKYTRDMLMTYDGRIRIVDDNT